MTDDQPKRYTGGYAGDVPSDIKVNYGYSKFIRFFRKFMILIAIGFIAAVAVWMQYYNEGNAPVTPTPDETAPRGQAALIEAQFDGIDSENRPYRVTADKATRSTDNADLVDLDRPTADLLTSDEKWLVGKANTGAFDQTTSVLDLNGSVKLYYDDGTEFTLDQARLNLKDTSATSDDPVMGQGPSGRITGQALNITEGGNMITFKGPATLRLRTAKAKYNE